jgi:phosphoglucosamine mutase
MIAIDETGTVRDGDYTLGICTQDLVQRDALGTRCIVGTVMSNFGLEEMLRGLGIVLHRAPVGDRYVLDEMRRTGAILGGEQSGHIVFLAHATTGDGLVSALQLLRVMLRTGKPLSHLSSVLTKHPQVLLNVGVRERIDPLTLLEVQQAHAHAQQMLNGAGRILVRLSGTERLARVMVEGRNPQAIQTAAECIAHAIERALGATTVIPTEL